jgi:hypothetical protein
VEYANKSKTFFFRNIFLIATVKDGEAAKEIQRRGADLRQSSRLSALASQGKSGFYYLDFQFHA